MASNGKRVGVIGVGFGALVHVPAFRAEGWEVTAICSRNEERVAKAALELGVANTFTDFHDLVASDEVDAVAVVTPPAAHFAPVMAALEAGKPVLCEKPFAMNIREARTMRDAADERGLTGMVAHEFRLTAQRHYVKRLIDEGYVGDVQSVVVECDFAMGGSGGPRPMTWQANAEDGGGTLGSLGSHYLDSLRWWAGEITGVSARFATVQADRLDDDGNVVQADAEDTFSIQMTFANGALGTFSFTAAAPVGLGGRLTVMGSEGVLSTPQAGVNPRPDGVVLGANKGDKELLALTIPAELMPPEGDYDGRVAPFRLLVREFARGIDEATSPAPTFDDGVRVQQVLDAVRASAAHGGWVPVTP